MCNRVKTTSSHRSLRDDVFHGWTVSFISLSLKEEASYSDCHDWIIHFLMLFLISGCSVASFVALSAASLPGTPACVGTQHITT
jgi:hypothetical protein